jgi:hypothetical protein
MGVDIGRLRQADRIVGASAFALFVVLFLFKWYGGSASSSLGNVSVGASLNGWHSFHDSRWVWLITIVVALAVVASRAGVLTLRSPVSLSVVVAALGALSTGLIAYRILHHPSGAASGSIAGIHYSASYGIKIGIWLALLAAAGITYGGYLGIREEGGSRADPRSGDAETPAAPPANATRTQAEPPIPPPAAPPDPGGSPPQAGPPT